MARNIGVIQIQGTVGGMTFDRTGIVKQAMGPREIKSARTKENNLEFRTAAKQAKVIRDAISPLDVRDRLLSSRMFTVVRQGLGLDSTNERGKRILSNEEARQVLPGFELNGRMNLGSIAPLNVVVEADTLQVEKFGGGVLVPTDFYQPEGTTDIQIMAVVSTVDLRPNVLRVITISNVQSELGGELTLPDIPFAADADPELLKLAGVSVRFYQLVNGIHYRLSNGSHDVGRIVAVI